MHMLELLQPNRRGLCRKGYSASRATSKKNNAYSTASWPISLLLLLS